MESRTKNAVRNIIASIIYKIICILLPFVNRTIIILFLGAEYQGIGSLFTSILSVLNLAEMGFSTAVVYSMYQMVASSNIDEICSLLNYFRRVYRIIGIIILICGIILLPFLSYLINGTYPNDINIYFLFLIYLSQTVISYLLFGYKSVLLTAHQRLDLVNVILMITYIMQCLVQFFVLIFTRNYYLYVIVLPIFTIINNISTSIVTDKYFPQYTCKGEIANNVRLALKEQIKGLMINKVSTAIRDASDNIVISILFGLTLVAIYSNYYYILSSVYGILLMIAQSITASVGNSVAVETREKNYKDFIKFTFMFGCLNTFCTACLFGLYQPFIKNWIGEQFLLPQESMILFCIYFYSLNVCNTINIYFDTNGLWYEGRKLFIGSVILNLVLNFYLGKYFGVSGVVFATIFSLIIFFVFGRIAILYKIYFFEYKQSTYYLQQLFYVIVTVLSCVLIYFATKNIDANGIFELVLISLICFIIPNTVMFICYFRTKMFKVTMDFVHLTLKRKR